MSATTVAIAPRARARAERIVADFEAAATAQEMLAVLDGTRVVLEQMRQLPDQEPYRRCAAARDAAYARHMTPPPPEGLPFLDGEGLLHHLCGVAPGETDIAVWIAEWAKALRLAPSIAAARALRDANASHLEEVAKLYPLDVEEVRGLIEATIRGPKGGKPSYG